VPTVDEPPPRDAEVFLALLALLQEHGVPKAGRIASCSRQVYGDVVLYWVKSSDKAKALIAETLSDFLGRPFEEGHGTWPLSLDDVERILQQQGLHRIVNSRCDSSGSREAWGLNLQSPLSVAASPKEAPARSAIVQARALRVSPSLEARRPA
jgi:hypothetical protein